MLFENISSNQLNNWYEFTTGIDLHLNRTHNSMPNLNLGQEKEIYVKRKVKKKKDKQNNSLVNKKHGDTEEEVVKTSFLPS